MDPELLSAATAGDFQSFRTRVEEDPGRLSKTNAQGNTLLHVAARLGHRNLASWIGDLLPGLLGQKNSGGDTALHLAARAGHVPVVSSLVTMAFSDPYLWDALLLARNRDGNTALHEAVRNRHGCVVGRLMKARPDLTRMVNDLGESTLYLAAEWACPETVKILLDSEGAAWEGPGCKTALHAAVHRSYGEGLVFGFLPRCAVLPRDQGHQRRVGLHRDDQDDQDKSRIVKHKQRQESKKGDRKAMRTTARTKFDIFMSKDSLVNSHSAVTGNNAFGTLLDVTKNVDELSLTELLDGSFKCPNLCHDKVKKASNANENILLSVRKAASFLATPSAGCCNGSRKTPGILSTAKCDEEKYIGESAFSNQ